MPWPRHFCALRGMADEITSFEIQGSRRQAMLSVYKVLILWQQNARKAQGHLRDGELAQPTRLVNTGG